MKVHTAIHSKWFFCLALIGGMAFAQSGTALKPQVGEKLDYEIEWHMIRAGVAQINIVPEGSGWKADLHLESAGTISRLYRVLESYQVHADSKSCPTSTTLDAQEGKKHFITRLIFDGNRHKVNYNSQDLVRNVNTQKELDTAPCAREILSALFTLRNLNLEPGKSGVLAVTDGKKFANARVEAQAKEKVNIDGKDYEAMRYEAFLFDNVIYKRKGRLLIWISEDADHLPLQLRFQMGFPVGNILVQLQRPNKQ